MEIQDDTEKHFALLAKQKEALIKAKARQGQRPTDRKSKFEAYNGFMQNVMARQFRQKMQLDKGHMMIHSSFIPPAYPPCITPAADLRPIQIRDLQLETHHRGRCLILRSLTPPDRMTAIMAIMADERDDAILVQLYQQEDEDFRKADDVVNTGTIFLVKEPYFKQTADGGYGLRLDHLSDFLRLNEDDSRIPAAWRSQSIKTGITANSLKLRGNTAMKKGEHWEAITL